jgi:hypothetical protein
VVTAEIVGSCESNLGDLFAQFAGRFSRVEPRRRAFAIVLWYAASGHRPEVVTERRVEAPWYLSKTDPSFLDMLTTLRRAMIATRFMAVYPVKPNDVEIRQVQRAWALASA